MDNVDRKAAIRRYKETPTPMGVYAIRNHVKGSVFVGTSRNLPAALNRDRFQLKHGSHPNRELQKDWNADGESAFAFETLDTLEPRKDEGDASDDLAALESMWRESVSGSAKLYNGGPPARR